MYVAAGSSFEAVYESGVSGLVPGIEVAIIDNLGAVTFGPTSVGITEQIVLGQPTGIYEVVLTAPVDPEHYTIVWSMDGSFDPKTVAVEDLFVVAIGVILPPIGPPGVDGPVYGPCSLWANVDQISACCTLPTDLDPFVLIALLTAAATQASQILWELSGRIYSGACSKVVRPCDTGGGCGCGYQVLSRGYVVGWDGSCWNGGSCSCTPLSRIKLSGYPVRSITEVKIDGIVLDPSEYRLDEWRWLTRTNGARWPSCQTLDVADTEVGTFSTTYVHGQDPPLIAQSAAAQFACEVFKSCPGSGAAECALPTGVTRVTRQGIQIERTFMRFDPVLKAWRTGMASVDLYLNSVAGHGLTRRPAVWSPDGSHYARPVG